MTNSERWRHCLSAVWQLLTFNPGPIPRPQLDPGFDNLHVLARVVEVLRYRLAELEYTLSPCGTLREWGLLWFRILLCVGIPVIVLTVVCKCVAELLAAIFTGLALIIGILVLLAILGVRRR